MSSASPDSGSLVGRLVADKYRIDRLIGRGGMGSVYEATNTTINKRVALKFLDASSDPEAVLRFQREAQSASAVESAHIVQIFDSGTAEDGRPYIVMEFLHGEDLRGLLRREGQIALPEAVHIITQALRGLVRAHDAGIVHRDLKPDNVFLNARDDDPLFVKLVDFGISKVAQSKSKASTLTAKGTVMGTAFYMSPEQAQAFPDVDGRADLYSLGAIFYEALTGKPPHEAPSYEAVLVRACTHDAPDVRDQAPDVPEAVAKVIAKALARARDARFQNAQEFYEALAEAAPDLVVQQVPIVSRPLSSSNPGQRRAIGDAAQTADGTTLQTSQGKKNHASRTVVAAIIAALGAFALTVFLVKSNANEREREREATVTAASAPVKGIASSSTADAEPSVAPAQTAVAAPSASTDPPSQGSAPPARRPAQPKPAHTSPAPTAKPAQSPGKKGGGVASGLKLREDGP